MRDFRDLKVWEKAHRLTLAVYKATLLFPKEELSGLTSQIRPPLRPFLLILLKDVDAAGRLSSLGFCKLRWDPRVSWNIISCWPTSSTSYLWEITSVLQLN